MTGKIVSVLLLALAVANVANADVRLDIIMSARNSRPLADGEPDPNVIFPMVSTPLGQLRGQTEYSRSGKLYYSFKGIPYAKTPVRFQPSVLVQPWEGLLDARASGAVCAQTNSTGHVIGVEDCLFLNVYFPHYDRCQTETESGKLAVYVHIHGGAFTSGNGAVMGSKYLLDECIVFVSINYRLGALGGSSVSQLVTSPMAAGLFSSVIASSGGPLNPFTIQENPLKYANELGQKLGCSTATSSDLKACLESTDLYTIISNQANEMTVAFGPTIEPLTAADPFQTENPAVLYRNGEFNRVPLIIGFTKDEGITLNAGVILADPELTSQVNNSWLELAPTLLVYEDLGLNQSEKDRISMDIRHFYFGDKDIGQETRQALVDLYSDRFWIQGAFLTVELHSKFAPVYSYVTTYKGGVSGASLLGYEIPAIAHAEDGYYLYDGVSYPEIIYGTEQYEFSTRLVKYWTNFAKTGQPSSETGLGAWNVTTGDSIHQLDLIEMELVNYLTERQTFWRNLGLYEYELQ